MSFRKPPHETPRAAAAMNGPEVSRAELENTLRQAAEAQSQWEARAGRRAILEAAFADAPARIRDALAAADAIPEEFVLPGPTGESNRMTLHARGVMLCLGPDSETALAQAAQALAFGNAAVIACADTPPLPDVLAREAAPVFTLSGRIDPGWLGSLDGFAGVACTGDDAALRAIRRALAGRDGPILPLIADIVRPERYFVERHLCVDTTAAGGNAALLAQSA